MNPGFNTRRKETTGRARRERIILKLILWNQYGSAWTGLLLAQNGERVPQRCRTPYLNNCLVCQEVFSFRELFIQLVSQLVIVYLFLRCDEAECPGTQASSGWICRPRMTDENMQRSVAVETEVLGDHQTRCHSVRHKPHANCPGTETELPQWEVGC